MRSSLVLFVLFTSFLSCLDHQDHTDFQYLNSNTTYDIYSAAYDSSGLLHLVGGNVWLQGIHIRYDSLNENVKVDSFANKASFDMIMASDTNFLAVGTDGYLHSYNLNRKRWQFYRLANWDILTDIQSIGDGSYIASGGKAYETGYIYLINENRSIDTVIYFPYEISHVHVFDRSSLVNCGWAHVMTSQDGGLTWKRSDITGDHFLDMVSLQGIMYMISLNGHLYSSSDNGLTWDEKKSIDGGFDSFRSLTAIEDNLIITGSKGRVWASSDLGMTWTKYQTKKGDEWLGCVAHNSQKLLLYGSNGAMAILNL